MWRQKRTLSDGILVINILSLVCGLRPLHLRAGVCLGVYDLVNGEQRNQT
jgi:hypothetical protein